MAVDPSTFGANLYLLVGLLLAALLAVLVVLAVWTALNYSIWNARRRQAEAEDRRRRFRPDGRPYPPAGRGMCDRCAQACETVYHEPSGERLCRSCYEQRSNAASRPSSGPPET